MGAESDNIPIQILAWLPMIVLGRRESEESAMTQATSTVQTGSTGAGRVIRVLSGRQLRRLENAPDARSKRGHRDKLILHLLGHGLRPIEVARLKIEHIEREGGRTRLRFVGAKNNVTRGVTLKPATARLLDKWIERTGPTFYLFVQRGQEHISVRTLQRICDKRGQEIGIADCHPYLLRHTVGTTLTRKSNDLWAVARYIGNSPAVCAKYYAAWLTKDSDRMADLLATAS